MIFDYRFWHFLLTPSSLKYVLDQEDQSEKIRGYKKYLWLIFLFTLAVFVLRNIWGMSTEGLTAILVTGSEDLYSFARLISLSGSLLWGISFFIFHYFLLSYALHVLTEIEFKIIQKVQLYTILFIVIEKVILFITFAMVGFTTPLSFFSFAPTLAYFTQDLFILYFVNQLTVATLITVTIQYIFLSQWEEESKKVLLTKLIFIQILLAFIIAGLSLLPISTWLERGVS